MSEYAGATPPASPTPTPMRIKKSPPNEPARPHAALKPLQTTSATVMIQVRLARSASHAIGSPSVE